MQLVHDGDARAFEIIFDRHAGVAFSLAYRMCGRRAMAEDVVQEAFLSLWRSGARYDRRRGSVRSWVLSVVHNRAIDAFRRETVRAGKRRGRRRGHRADARPTSGPTRRSSAATRPTRYARRWASCPPISAR